MSPPAEVQLAWLAAALEALPDFLRSGDVFRPLPDSPSEKTQDLSLGGLLLALDSLTATEDDLSAEARARWMKARRVWQEEAARHAAAIERKASAELTHRRNLWTAYLDDLGENPREAERYPVEVRHRAIIDRLLGILGEVAADNATKLARSDDRLRTMFRAGSFVWAPELKPVYPEVPFWYLYGRPA